MSDHLPPGPLTPLGVLVVVLFAAFLIAASVFLAPTTTLVDRMPFTTATPRLERPGA